MGIKIGEEITKTSFVIEELFKKIWCKLSFTNTLKTPKQTQNLSATDGIFVNIETKVLIEVHYQWSLWLRQIGFTSALMKPHK